jgi:centromere protein C
MPTSVCKSSVGAARRGPLKAYLPYRGGQSEVGKKTGLIIPQVERKSDGFEPFEEVLRRMDAATPLRPKRKKSIVPDVNPEYDEEDGEVLMLDSMSICVVLS